MIGRPSNSVEFAKRGLHGRHLTPEEIAIEAERLGLPVSGPSEGERASRGSESGARRRHLQDEADILADER
jgi:hypothetical protein